MYSKRIQAILVVLLIAIMMFPNIPAGALAPLPKDVTIAYHNLTGMASFMGSPSDGQPIRMATAQDLASSNEEVARSFLSVYGDKFGINILCLKDKNRILRTG